MITLRIRNLGGDTRHFDTALDLAKWLFEAGHIDEAGLRSLMRQFYSRKPVGSEMMDKVAKSIKFAPLSECEWTATKEAAEQGPFIRLEPRQMVDLQSGEVFEKCKVSTCQNEAISRNGLCEHHVINGNPEAKKPQGIITARVNGEAIKLDFRYDEILAELKSQPSVKDAFVASQNDFQIRVFLHNGHWYDCWLSDEILNDPTALKSYVLGILKGEEKYAEEIHPDAVVEKPRGREFI